MKLRIPKWSIKFDPLVIGIIIYFCFIPIVGLTKPLMESSDIRKGILAVVCWIFIIGGCCFANRFKVLDALVLYFVIGSIFLITYIVHPEYKDVYDEVVWSHVFAPLSGLSGFIVARQLTEFEKLKKVLKATAIITFLYYFYKSFEVLRGGGWISYAASTEFSNSSMDFGYGMLHSVLMFFALYLDEKKKLYLIPGVVGALEIVAFGGRGPVLCILVFVLLYFIFGWMINQDIKHKALKISLLIILTVLVVVFFDAIVDTTINLLSEVGIKSRGLEMLLRGEISYNNGRTRIQQQALNMISKDHLFSGYGPLGDMYFIHSHSHNIIVEMMFDFGIIPGILFFSIVILIALYVLMKSRKSSLLPYYLIFLSAGLVKLMVSETFWRETSFWFMLGLSVNFIQIQKAYKELPVYFKEKEVDEKRYLR